MLDNSRGSFDWRISCSTDPLLKSRLQLLKWLTDLRATNLLNLKTHLAKRFSEILNVWHFVLDVIRDVKWARSWDYCASHIGDQRRLRQTCACAQSRHRAFAVRTHNVCKSTKGPSKNQISSATGWLRMRVWGMSLRRTKSTLISWHLWCQILFANWYNSKYLEEAL